MHSSLKSVVSATLLALVSLSAQAGTLSRSDIREYTPKVSTARTERVSLELVRLYTPEKELAARTTASAIAGYIKQVEAQARQTLRAHTGAATVLVHFDCEPTRCEVGTLSRGEVASDVLLELQRRLRALPVPKTEGVIRFAAQFEVRA